MTAARTQLADPLRPRRSRRRPIERNLQAQKPDRKWGADISCIWTAQGGLHVAVMLDLHTRWVPTTETTGEVFPANWEIRRARDLPSRTEGRLVRELLPLQSQERDTLFLTVLRMPIGGITDALACSSPVRPAPPPQNGDVYCPKRA